MLTRKDRLIARDILASKIARLDPTCLMPPALP
jgi:hypothetical protein